ncbi:MAG TPA: NAD+ synthase [Kiritimatiellia bacterium]|nr:NAD+ synthase [Kiritimatiellia bacterium]
MNTIALVLAQINPTVGALESNADRILDVARQAAANGAQLVVFPELALSGYPPEDLVLKPHFIEDVAHQLDRIASALPPDLVVIAGAPVGEAGRVYNAAIIFHRGAIQGRYLKMCLPNYGVFDEKRVFSEGATPLVLGLGSLRVGVHICEDSWSVAFDSVRRLENAGLDALINLSASPYHRGKQAHRRHMLAETARRLKAPLLYVNLVGGQDELVFDGRSLVIDANGDCMATAATFREDTLGFEVTTLSKPAPKSSKDWNFLPLEVPKIGTFSLTPPPPVAADDDLAEVYAALALGLADYVNKNGFARVIIAISGGIDSALVASIAVDALGPERVVGITMPSRYSSEGTYSDARELAERLGIDFHDRPIHRLHELFLDELEDLWPGRLPDTTEENLQARIRGNIVMALSNKFGWLVLTTGNKSEMATGYCTLYGDMAGGFALIKDVPKTLVFELCRWRNERSPEAPPIPESIITRPPSAELRENQKDQDSLPPYDMLDGIIERYVERDWSAEKIIAGGFDAATVTRVIRLIDLNEYKRRQGPPGVKITPKSFGRDRRLPITNLYHERVKTTGRGAHAPASPHGKSS